MRCSAVKIMVSAFILAVASNAAHGAERVESLLPYLPATTNGLSVVRVHDVLASPRAVREKWDENPARFLAGADTVPHWVELFVMGSQVHPGRDDGWSATVVPLPAGISLESIAKRERLSLETLGGVSAALAGNSYYLQIGPQVLGVITPAHRQDAARWARSTQTAEAPQLSPYLQEKSGLSGQILLALDMQDMLDPAIVESRLKASAALRDNPEMVGELHQAINGLRGVAFSANITEETQALITFDFSAPLPNSAATLKELFLEFLVDEKLMIPDLRESEVTVDGQKLILRVALSDPGLRQIMSLVLAPYPTEPTQAVPAAAAQPTTPAEPDADAKKRLNRNYYAKVHSALRDLQQSVKFTFGATKIAEQAGWVDQAANKINAIPIQGVDTELVKFGADVAHKLKAISDSLRGMAVSVNVAQGTLTVQRVVYGNRWGGHFGGYGPGWGATMAPIFGTKSNLQEVREKQGAAVTKSVADRQKIWQSLDADHAAIRELMLKRYDEDFDKAYF